MTDNSSKDLRVTDAEQARLYDYCSGDNEMYCIVRRLASHGLLPDPPYPDELPTSNQEVADLLRIAAQLEEPNGWEAGARTVRWAAREIERLTSHNVDLYGQQSRLGFERDALRAALQAFVAFQIGDHFRQADAAKRYCEIRREAVKILGGRPAVETSCSHPDVVMIAGTQCDTCKEVWISSRRAIPAVETSEPCKHERGHQYQDALGDWHNQCDVCHRVLT